MGDARDENRADAGQRGGDAGSMPASEPPPDDTGFFSGAGETVNHVHSAEEDHHIPPAGRRLGDYELIERIGAGGMGVVYRAQQLSADRIVAVKLIRQDQFQELEREQLQEIVDRFRIEAQAAARLDHPNIVAVYDVGEAEGQPFFSMRFVPGRSLADILRAGPLEARRASLYLVPLGRAVQHAHDNGILHRDLKPQNVLIDQRNDTPNIADFGLAKLAVAESSLTRHGEVIGTPQYMSPEQSRDAAAVTALSDVYSLGATLYHLLTGRPPFQAATVAETLRQVLLEVPVPPRRLNPAVARDLETICLKCLEKEPRRRYGSAGEFADDLQRFLDRRPIRARRTGIAGRTWRWMRRNPAIAALTIAVISFIGVAVTATIVGNITTGIARDKAERSFELAQGAVDRFFTMFSEEVMLDQPGMQPYRRELLEEAGKYYQDFLSLTDDNESALADQRAATRFRIGVITELLEGPRDALEQFQVAQRAQSTLFATKPTESRRYALADTWNALGRTYHQLNDFDRAAEAYAAAIELRQRSANVEAQRKLANSLMNRGLLMRDQGSPIGAMQEMQRAQQLRQEVVSAGPDLRIQLRVNRDLAMGYYNWANMLIDADQVEQAKSRLSEAIRCFAEVREAQPFDVQNRFRLALCHRDFADLESSVGDAVAAYTQALEVLKPLVEQNSQVAAYRSELAAVMLNLSELAYQQGKLETSLGLLGEARDHYTRLADAGLDVAEQLRGIEVSWELVKRQASENK